MRSVIDRTGIVEFLAERLCDPRDQDRVKHPLAQLLLQWLLQLILGWDGLWSEQLRTDPALGATSRLRRGDRVVGSEGPLASQSTLSRFLGLLGMRGNLACLKAALRKLAVEHMLARNGGARLEEAAIDVDAMPIDAHGGQSGSKYNGHYKRTVFLPLFASCGEHGDVLGAELRPGVQREVTDCEEFIVSIADAVKQHAADRVIIRMDAGFNGDALCARLEAEGVGYVMRLRKNPVLERMAEPYLSHRASETTQHIELAYQAKSWACAPRVVLVVKPRPGELFDDFHFLITNLDEDQYTGKDLAILYRRRGKAEMHQGEIKEACSLSLPSSPRPKSHCRQVPIACEEQVEADAEAKVKEETEISPENRARLQIYLLVYQLMHIARELFHRPPSPVEPESESHAEESAPLEPSKAEEPRLHIHSFRLYLLKIGARLARHGRYATFYIASSAVQAWQRFWAHFQQLRWHSVPDF